ncbi:Rid family detoxifying hydrolase [Riemerella columbina]|uniref:Rid family detoxifying hydrolase n=1 Tax=Riemerella columbina TaxID=103810 RepID=UPI00266ED764|nr:Rid family detoxifying hydrolase [Riemerella columbina]WKS95103.1 Rid family detoxifying hydrolase [Riemerella columbina]
MKTIISTTGAPAAIGPYAQANMVQGVLYISGQIPINPETGEVEQGIEAQTHRVMRNLVAILSAAGLSFSHVVKATIFLQDMNDFEVVNGIYASYLDETMLPARETIQVSRLPKGVSVEISMIAHQF